MSVDRRAQFAAITLASLTMLSCANRNTDPKPTVSSLNEKERAGLVTPKAPNPALGSARGDITPVPRVDAQKPQKPSPEKWDVEHEDQSTGLYFRALLQKKPDDIGRLELWIPDRILEIRQDFGFSYTLRDDQNDDLHFLIDAKNKVENRRYYELSLILTSTRPHNITHANSGGIDTLETIPTIGRRPDYWGVITNYQNKFLYGAPEVRYLVKD